MGTLVAVLIFALVFFAVGVSLLTLKKYEAGTTPIVFGIALFYFVVFVAAPIELCTGRPASRIDKGEYKVAFVYVAGENVNIGIEKNIGEGKDKSEELFLYQFPKSDFGNGPVNIRAKKLVVVEPGEFRKLMLE